MNDQYTCIIVDDEQNAIDLLRSSIDTLYKNLSVVGSFTSWDEALHGLKNTPVDILFMDVSIPGKNGINLLRLVPHLDCEVIFITAYEEFALSAFEFSTSGYLLKPYDDEELCFAIEKAFERTLRRRAMEHQHYAKEMAVANSKIAIPNARGMDYIGIDDIIYMESVNKSTKIVTKSGEITSSYHIGKFTPILANNMFYRVHRCYIINVHCMVRYTSGIILMSNNKEVPIAKHFRDTFLKLFRIVSDAGSTT